MPKPCSSPDCQTTIGDEDEFCGLCEIIVWQRFAAVEEDVGQILRLEAEFAQWCAENGKPPPHS